MIKDIPKNIILVKNLDTWDVQREELFVINGELSAVSEL